MCFCRGEAISATCDVRGERVSTRQNDAVAAARQHSCCANAHGMDQQQRGWQQLPADSGHADDPILDGSVLRKGHQVDQG